MAVRVTSLFPWSVEAVVEPGGGSRVVGPSLLPMLVPGHEFVGKVTAVGSDVERFSVGDPVAVGNIVDSCGVCYVCIAHQENYCVKFPTLTYGGVDRHDGERTLGAYSNNYVAAERFVYHLPRISTPPALRR